MKDYTKIYRFEKKTDSEEGPYVNHSWYNHTADHGRPAIGGDIHVSGPKACDNYTCRGMLEERGIEVNKILFGFRWKKQLHKWFTKKEQARLARLGFVCRTYYVPKDQLCVYEKQVMFNNAQALTAI